MHSSESRQCRRVAEWYHGGFLTRAGSNRDLEDYKHVENTCVMAAPRSRSVGATSSYAQQHRLWSRQRKLGEKRGHCNDDIHVEANDRSSHCKKVQDQLMRSNTLCEELPQKSPRSVLASKVVAFMKRKVTALGNKSRYSSNSFDLDEEWSWKSMAKDADNDRAVNNRVSNVYNTLSNNKRPLPSPPSIRPPPPLPPAVPVRMKQPARRQTITGNCAPTIASARTPQTAEVKLVRIIRLDKLLKNKWISGIAVTKKNEYLIVDLKEAHIIDEFGNVKRTIGSKGLKRLQEPIDATVMTSGNIAVSDHAAREVKVYNAKGQFIHAIRDDSLCNIAGVASNADDNIVVAGTDKQRISVFSNSGVAVSAINSANGGSGNSDDTWKLLCDIPSAATDDQQAFCRRPMFDHPYSVAVNPLTGHVIVGDDYRQLVTAVCCETGRVLWRFTPPGDRNRHFFPSSICVDNDGYVFVADLYNEKVYMLDSSGKYLKAILSRGDGLKGGPGAIAVDGRGHLIVADEEKMLKIFKYGENGFALYRRFSYCPNVV